MACKPKHHHPLPCTSHDDPLRNLGCDNLVSDLPTLSQSPPPSPMANEINKLLGEKLSTHQKELLDGHAFRKFEDIEAIREQAAANRLAISRVAPPRASTEQMDNTKDIAHFDVP